MQNIKYEFPDHGPQQHRKVMDAIVRKSHANFMGRVELALERWLGEGVCVYLVYKPLTDGGGCDILQNKTNVVLEHIPLTRLVLTNDGR